MVMFFSRFEAISNMTLSSLLIPLFGLVNRKKKGIFVLDKEWDVLVILDACRCDFFKVIYKRFGLNGRLKCVTSRGSNTKEFLDENFSKQKSHHFDDIIYVSANPFVELSLKNKIHKIISVWRSEWNHTLGTVHPSSVYEAALKAFLKYYPKKRVIIHFIQPHYPFRLLRNKSLAMENFANLTKMNRHNWLIYASLWISAIRDHKAKLLSNESRGQKLLKIIDNPIYMIDKKTLIRAYLDNLLWVMKYVKKLVNVLFGKIVITSDHGDSFGERLNSLPIAVYGHPPFIRMKQLVRVPWLEIKRKGNKKSVLKELINLKKKKKLRK